MSDQASGDTYNLNINVPPADGSARIEPDTLVGSSSASLDATAGADSGAEFSKRAGEISRKTKLIAAAVGIGLAIVLVLLGWFLYSLGYGDDSPLERLRDMSIVLSMIFFVIATIVFTAVIAVMAYIALVIKDEAIPAINALTETLVQVKGATEFMTESMARPIIKTSSTVAGWRAAIKTITRK